MSEQLNTTSQGFQGLGRKLTVDHGGIPNVSLARAIAEYIVSLTGGSGVATSTLLKTLQNGTRVGVSSTLLNGDTPNLGLPPSALNDVAVPSAGVNTAPLQQAA